MQKIDNLQQMRRWRITCAVRTFVVNAATAADAYLRFKSGIRTFFPPIEPTDRPAVTPDPDEPVDLIQDGWWAPGRLP